jgi:hypothetical protein
MRRTSRIPGIVCCVAVVATFSTFTDALANCQNEGPYPVTQCATRAGTPSWFAPRPLDAGNVDATWWILGSGNRPAVDTTIGVSTNPIDGDGFIDTPNPGIFIGIDSGRLSVGPVTGDPSGGLDLIDAQIGTGSTMAAGGLCFSASANWALPFVDGCSDQNRSYASLGRAGNFSDNYANPYFAGATGGPGVFTDYALVDAPMAVLLTESNNKYFAIAFFSSTNRNHDPDDIFDKGYDMGAIINGDDNPAAPAGNDNIIPWQLIPQPYIAPSAVDTNGNRLLSVQWFSIRIVRDNSRRPVSWASIDPNMSTLGKDRNGAPVTGVGVMEQPDLVSHVVELRPLTGGFDCDANAPWAPAHQPVVPPITTPGGTPMAVLVTVPNGVCVRLTTRFGRVPSETFAGSPADAATRNRNRQAAQAGNLGDIGYEVHSNVFRLGGQLASDKPILKSAILEQRNLVVEFETPGEMGIESFQVVATDRRGATSVVATVDCAQCASGIGSAYRVEIPVAAVKTARSVHVVVQPSGTASDALAISRPAPRPAAPGRTHG